MIQWLTTLKTAKEIVHLSRHYVLKVGNSFFVFTSKPVEGLHIVSNLNIDQKPQPQVLIEKVHQADYSKMSFRTTENCIFFEKKNEIVLNPFRDKLAQEQPIIEKVQTFFEKTS